MKTIILSLAIATSTYTHSTTSQLTSAQVYAQIEAINNAAAQESLSTGYAHPWVTPPEMFESTTSTQESIEEIDAQNQQYEESLLPWCGDSYRVSRFIPCNSNYVKGDN